MTPAQRSLYGRIGAAVARSKHDPRELTAAGRATFLARFERQVREQFPAISEAEIQRRAGEARKAHMLRLAARSAESRSKKKAARVSGQSRTAVAEGHGNDRTAA